MFGRKKKKAAVAEPEVVAERGVAVVGELDALAASRRAPLALHATGGEAP